ncbi:DUF2239 family protein [Cupriavidus sp. BIS7]|uniref:DUF2239 family protein n=1 Tax=Cupriavidus sp. BIS7 TaxID=1217718 RepID=UPI0002E4861A|nr:DUF2239 family protein [Cupriavidus sp. BIS7]
MTQTATYTSFNGYQRIASGPLLANALAVKQVLEAGTPGPVLIFDDATGRSIDVDIRGTEQEIASRLPTGTPRNEHPDDQLEASETSEASAPKGRGRPKLGVVAREVTLLPRHWEWLAAQPGGASVALRKLVEEARRTGSEKARLRQTQERAYHFMLAIAGDLPGYEEATRALFANDQARLQDLIGAWPTDVRNHALHLAASAPD